MARGPVEKPDISERGGNDQSMDRRLFMQLLVFGDCTDIRPVAETLPMLEMPCVLYEDVHDPRGVAILTMSEDPAAFVDTLRPLLNRAPFSSLRLRPELTMFGRTYALGYEPDLEETLFTRPRRTALNPDWPWAVWYPLRRSGRFMQLPDDEARSILMEHGRIGHAFGSADYAHDIRLACHGLDRHDNDFVVGLVGRELYPLSAVVQAMRRTKQTAEYLESLGPFFIGRAVYQSER